MKKQHLIFITALAVIILFYKEYVALNLGILGIFLSILTYIETKAESRNRTFLALFVTSFFSSFAFAWFGDAVSFSAVFVSVFLLRFKGSYPKLKPFLYVEILFINLFTFLGRVFETGKWYEKTEHSSFSKKLLTFVLIPGLFIVIFLCIYSAGSAHFDKFFSDIKLDFNFFNVFILAILGFYIGFIFWNFGVDKFILK